MKEKKDLSALTPEERVGEYAVENFKRGLNCSECILEALVREGELDISREQIGMCIGFGAGVGLQGCLCGALAGAVLANGIRYGRKDPYTVDDAVRAQEVAGKYYRRYHAMVNEFVEEQGDITCAGISAPYGDWMSRERKINCLKLIGATARLAYRYLQLPQEEAFKLPYEGNTMHEFHGEKPDTWPLK